MIIIIKWHCDNLACNSARDSLFVCYINHSMVVCKVKFMFSVKLCWVFSVEGMGHVYYV
jgi:hypothetical protein